MLSDLTVRVKLTACYLIGYCHCHWVTVNAPPNSEACVFELGANTHSTKVPHCFTTGLFHYPVTCGMRELKARLGVE